MNHIVIRKSWSHYKRITIIAQEIEMKKIIVENIGKSKWKKHVKEEK